MAEYVSQNPYDALLRLDKHGPGVAGVGAFNLDGQSMSALNFYLYGDQATEAVARETPMANMVSRALPDAVGDEAERMISVVAE